MYLKVVLTFLLLMAGAIALRVWRPPPPAMPLSVAGALQPYDVWPHDKVGVDPILEKRIEHVTIDATRLDAALIQFRQQCGVNLVWNQADLPVMSGEPIRMEFRNTTVVDALTELLALGLRPPPIGTRDGIVVIGSNAVVTRFYDVRSILPNIRAPLPATESGGGGAVFGRPATKEELQEHLLMSIVERELKGQYEEHGLEDAVVYWNGILIVHEHPDAHRKLIRLFETLRSGDPVNRQGPRPPSP